MLLKIIFIFLICTSLSAKELTLEEKVGQLLLVHFQGSEVNQAARTLIEQVHVSGFIFYEWSNGLETPYQVQNLTFGLQKHNTENGSSIPLFMAVDQEGGPVMRLKTGFTTFQSPKTIGSVGDPELAFRVAEATGKELKAVGINVNCAPVIDIFSDPNKPFSADRCFADSPQKVTLFGASALDGYKAAGICSILKHFPGHGDASADSHIAIPTVNKSIYQLEARELYPFRKLAPQADMVMVGHLLAEALDETTVTTFSFPVLSKLLRKDMAFDGVIISDSLVMKGLMQWAASYEEAALRAFQAGCDLICLGGKLLNSPDQEEISVDDVIRIYQFLIDAVRNGTVSEKRLNASVARILTLKKRYSMEKWNEQKSLGRHESVTNPEHEHLKKVIEHLLFFEIASNQRFKSKAVSKNILLVPSQRKSSK